MEITLLYVLSHNFTPKNESLQKPDRFISHFILFCLGYSSINDILVIYHITCSYCKTYDFFIRYFYKIKSFFLFQMPVLQKVYYSWKLYVKYLRTSSGQHFCTKCQEIINNKLSADTSLASWSSKETPYMIK